MTDFLYDSGTGGLVVSTALDLMTTELNSLASGAAATSSVGGTSGAFTQTNFASAIWGLVQFKAGGSFTPVAGQVLWGWFLQSLDGTNFETAVATASTTVSALSRNPDFIIPLDNAAFTSSSIRLASGLVRLPPVKSKLLLQNSGTTALPSSGNKITVGPIAVKY